MNTERKLATIMEMAEYIKRLCDKGISMDSRDITLIESAAEMIYTEAKEVKIHV